MTVTHICSLKDAATIVQQEASYFNVAHCCSSQKGSLTNLHIRRELTLTAYTCMYTTVVHSRALDMHYIEYSDEVTHYINKCRVAVYYQVVEEGKISEILAATSLL